MTYIVVWVLFGIAAAMFAGFNGRSVAGWFFLGCLFGPFALLFALILGRPEEEGVRKCPFCAELVKKEAVVCKHCGNDLPSIAEPKTPDTFEVVHAPMGRAETFLRCPKCGKFNAPDAEKCAFCGFTPAKA